MAWPGLNEYMGHYAPRQLDALKTHEASFRQTVQNIYAVFGSNSARLYEVDPLTNEGNWDTKFSVMAFDIQASALWDQPTMKVQLAAEQIREMFLFTLLTDGELQASITKATASGLQTGTRWKKFRACVEPILAGTVIEPRFFALNYRKRLFEQSQICQICKNEIHLFEDCTIDHITPYSRGGKTRAENGQLAHRGCNASKNAKILELAETSNAPAPEATTAPEAIGPKVTTPKAEEPKKVVHHSVQVFLGEQDLGTFSSAWKAWQALKFEGSEEPYNYGPCIAWRTAAKQAFAANQPVPPYEEKGKSYRMVLVQKNRLPGKA